MIIADEKAMLEAGMMLAKKLKPGHLVAIEGPLGAGKTVLCRGVLRGLGFDGEVASPSYAIVHSYGPPDIPHGLLHADLYRLEDREELDETGLLDRSQDELALVEWANRVPAFAEMADITVMIDILPDSRRKVSIKG